MKHKILFKAIIPLILLLILSSIVYAEKSVIYDAKINGSEIDVTLLIEFESEKAINVFEGAIVLPEQTIIKEINDSKGAIKEFTLNNSVLSFRTNYSIAKNAEIVKIEMVWQGLISEEYAPLYCPTLSFSGIQDYKTKINISADRVLSFNASAGFELFYSEKKIRVEGSGPANVTVCYAKKNTGKEFEHFVLFNSSEDISKADELFYLIPLTLGVQNIYNKYPIYVMNDKKYEKKLNTYSQGTHLRGGLSIIKESTFKNGDAIETILHETVHAFNEYVFRWNNTKAAWLDEGIAKTIERIVEKKLGKRTPNLFYKSIVYVEGPMMITLYPTSDWRLLLKYYKNNDDFMEYWNPTTNQEFGYAYSELFVKEFLKENGLSALKNAYKKFLEIDELVNEEKEFTKKAIEILGAKKKPCYYLTQEELQTCLDKVNAFNVVLPEKAEVIIMGKLLEETGQETIVIDSKKIKEMEKKEIAKKLKNFEEKIQQLIRKMFNSIGILLEKKKWKNSE